MKALLPGRHGVRGRRAAPAWHGPSKGVLDVDLAPNPHKR
jgi:hypothetical protein